MTQAYGLTLTDEDVAVLLANAHGDEYRLKTLAFQPDVLYDLGADVGSVSCFAHTLWPAMKAVAVEPLDPSFERLKANAVGQPWLVPVHAGLGKGKLYEPPIARPMERSDIFHWVTVGEDASLFSDKMVPSDVPAVSLAELYAEHGGEKFIVKFDCESAELCLFTDPASLAVLERSAYFAGEIHLWGATHEQVVAVARMVLDTLMLVSTKRMVTCEMRGGHLMVFSVAQGIV